VEPDPSVEARLYPGARHAGWVVLQVKKYDRPLLTFGRDFNGTGGIWFKLYH